MMPLECPIMTGLPSDRLEIRSKPEPARLDVPRHDRQAEVAELEDEPALGLFGLGELLERDGVVAGRAACA